MKLAQQAAEYNAAEEAAEGQLAAAMEELGEFELAPRRQRQPAVDEAYGRMGEAEVNAWMADHGLERVVPEEDPEGAAAEASGKGSTLAYRVTASHEDQEKDWTPYMEEEFASAEVWRTGEEKEGEGQGARERLEESKSTRERLDARAPLDVSRLGYKGG